MQKTILIADFEQEPTDELRQILLGEGFLVLTASDGEQALAVFEAVKPDLVLTEALLPKLNGFELCKKIARGQTPDVRPVIMYSAIYKGEKYQREAIDGCGAFEFLDKPIPKWQLLKTVRAAFSEAPRVKASAPPGLPGVATGDSPSATGSTGSEVGDPLEVDSLFESLAPGVAGFSTSPAGSPAVLETALVESGQALMPSIDSQEIDAALDSVRTDLHQEAQRRDEFLARQLELEIQQRGQSILEFESSLSAGQDRAEAVESTAKGGEFELDEVLPETAPEPPASVAASAADSAGKFPTLTIQQTSTRNRLPYLILVLLALLAAAYFWFWG